ncbi:hypothetical protein BDZ94DRAFT_1261023 [Collybia nuda]|uniref:Uncharacterized protein n=1 Tax=Collybia nuda TaxID=64659 RepID=A0A9P5Y575_9AGAR|nr:hypothetical protein BDZ94DRAFT_1261023 [Collybia nuda]
MAGGMVKDIREAINEIRTEDRGTRMRTIKKDGQGGEVSQMVVGRVSRPLPPIPVSAPGATKPVMTLPLGIPSSHRTPIPLPSFATAGKVIPKSGGNGDLASSAVALKIFGLPGDLSTSAPASTMHLPMGSTTAGTTSIGSLSQGISMASTTNTAITTPPSSPRKSRKSNTKSPTIAKRLSKSATILFRENSGGKEVGGGGIRLKGGLESSGDSSREGFEGLDPSHDQTKKRSVRHLSHTALALILERGRPISRRVLVTSSPLYQSMDSMERLGYEVRVYIRVPDLGDGMDRERHRHSNGHRRRHSGGGSGTATTSSGGSPKKKAKDHARRVSGAATAEITGTSASAGESGSKDTTTSLPSAFPLSDLSPTTTLDLRHHHQQQHYHLYERHALGHPLHPLFPHHEHVQHHQHPLRPSVHVTGSGVGGSAPPRIRYREQGVDELLQLKLHQALAAVDDVPEGATIVLATGDGNVGQFNEDGFLGPVRTALKRGWKVELYAWEDGLSRSWKREFGEESEWGQNGMFRIIGMEQFAHLLVDESG